MASTAEQSQLVTLRLAEEHREEEMRKDMEKTTQNQQQTDGEVLTFAKNLTVGIEIDGAEDISTARLIVALTGVCGKINACRQINPRKYEVTVRTQAAKDKLLDGFRLGESRVHSRDITTDELVVSFMGLPAYISDDDIQEKLNTWGVKAVSAIRRRMWPGTDVADGTRYVKVRFTREVQSLPYSAKFNTAAGSEFFRVIHDRQVRVCRGCLQPNHVLRECPDFLCRRCGGQGHYARECTEKNILRCAVCRRAGLNCVCADEDSVSEEEAGVDGETPVTPTSDAKDNVKNTNKCMNVSMEVVPGVKGGAELALPGPVFTQSEEALGGLTPNAGAKAAELGVREGMTQKPCPASERGQKAEQESRTAKQEAVQEEGNMVKSELISSSLRASKGRKKTDRGSTTRLAGVVGGLPSFESTVASAVPGSTTPLSDMETPMELVVEVSKKKQSESVGKKQAKKFK